MPGFAFLACKLEFPTRDDCGECEAHFIVGEGGAQAPPVASTKRQEFERTVGATDKPFGRELIGFRVNGGILMNGAYTDADSYSWRKLVTENLQWLDGCASDFRQDRVETWGRDPSGFALKTCRAPSLLNVITRVTRGGRSVTISPKRRRSLA